MHVLEESATLHLFIANYLNHFQLATNRLLQKTLYTSETDQTVQ